MFEYVSIISQTGTAIASLAVEILLVLELRLQHKDSSRATKNELTTGIVDWIGLMITDPIFTKIYLKAIEGKSILPKDEQHRFNVFMVSFFFRIEQLWESDNKSPDVPMYANIMLGTGPGVIDWYQSMGRFVMKPNFRDYIDDLIQN